jgi:FeS assembly SUF system protein
MDVDVKTSPHAPPVAQTNPAEGNANPAPSAPAPSTPAPSQYSPGQSQELTIKQKLIQGKVIAALRMVYDPEIPVNIYDLGLIYGVDVDPQTNAVHVRMTLTAPGCPVAGSLPGEVQSRVECIADIPSATVELVWDPPWTKERMSEDTLLALGLA